MRSSSQCEPGVITQWLPYCVKLNQDLQVSQKEISRLRGVISDVREINQSWQRHNSEMQRYIRRLEGSVCRLLTQLDHTSVHHYQDANVLLKTLHSELPQDHNMKRDLQRLCHSDIIFEMEGELSLVKCDGENKDGAAVRWYPESQTAESGSTHPSDDVTCDTATPGASFHLSDDITCPICQTAFPPHSNLVFLRHSELCIKSSPRM